MIITKEEKRQLDDGIESLHKKRWMITVMDIEYLKGFTKLTLDKIYSYCTGNYEVEG